MAEKKTLEERYADEVLTDNAALNHYSQCKDCIFRDKRVEDGEDFVIINLYATFTEKSVLNK